MSDARKCDICNELFEPTRGCVSIDVSVKGQRETYHMWNDVDFCAGCSDIVLDLIGAALHGLWCPRPTKKGRK
jgi:hypothetical protein